MHANTSIILRMRAIRWHLFTFYSRVIFRTVAVEHFWVMCFFLFTSGFSLASGLLPLRALIATSCFGGHLTACVWSWMWTKLSKILLVCTGIKKKMFLKIPTHLRTRPQTDLEYSGLSCKNQPESTAPESTTKLNTTAWPAGLLEGFGDPVRA